MLIDDLDRLIERLEEGHITREEYEVLKADLIASKRVPNEEEKIEKLKEPDHLYESNTRVTEFQPKVEVIPKVDSSLVKENSSSSKGGMWKWIVGGVVLCAGGYVGFDRSQQSALQSRVDALSSDAQRFRISVPSGRLSESDIVDLKKQIQEQSALQSRVDALSSDAQRFGFSVPSGRLEESDVVDLEKKLENRRQEIADVQALHNEKKIPSGSFIMGCTGEQEDYCFDDTRPTHRVTISRGFLLMDSEVTQALYEKVMGENPSRFKGVNRPVDEVSWFDAVSMANKLSLIEGLEECYSINGENVQWLNEDCTGWRLPTEAEWEYAARGGNYSHKYAGGNNVDDVAWYESRDILHIKIFNVDDTETHGVCEKKRNGYGLCDMSGNVWEWVWDWYASYNSSPSVDPRGPTSGSFRVTRSGSMIDLAMYTRVSYRGYDDPADASGNRGFRLARTSP